MRYVSHPEVVIDPNIPVPQWGLNETGRARTVAMLAQPWLRDVGQIIASAEQKALDTAAIIGRHLALEPEVRADTHENLRSGFLPPDEFETTADVFFARPEESVHGWERAIDAQARIRSALDDLISEDPTHDVVVVGHGGVGTLLFCALSGLEIDRRHDQRRAGNYFSFDRTARCIDHGWTPIDELDDQGPAWR